jgi:hypothetical protein
MRHKEVTLGEKLKLRNQKAEIRSGGMESAGLWISAFPISALYYAPLEA